MRDEVIRRHKRKKIVQLIVRNKIQGHVLHMAMACKCYALDVICFEVLLFYCLVSVKPNPQKINYVFILLLREVWVFVFVWFFCTPTVCFWGYVAVGVVVVTPLMPLLSCYFCLNALMQVDQKFVIRMDSFCSVLDQVVVELELACVTLANNVQVHPGGSLRANDVDNGIHAHIQRRADLRQAQLHK